METNTIIRTEDSINMGGSFLNETQVRLMMLGSLVSSDTADIKAELPLYNVHLTILTHLLVPHSREYYCINPVLSLQPIYCPQVLSLSRCLHYCCTYPLCNTAVFDERMDSTEVSRCQETVLRIK